MHVFVTGATGLIGRALCRALVERGHAVTALSRSASPPSPILSPAERGRGRTSDAPAPPGGAGESGSGSGGDGQSGVRLVQGDPTVPGPWQDELARADACVNLAGEPLERGRWNAERKRLIRASRVDSTRNVADVLRERGPKVLVSGSAVGFYGSRGDEVLDEGSGAGEGFLADVCREWEAAAERAAPRVRVTLLRTGLVLARGGGALPKLVRPFRLLAGGPLGDGAFYQPWIHLADEVGLVVLALEDGRARGPLNATAPTPVRNRHLARAIGEVLHRPSALPAPALAIRVAVGEMAGEILASQRAVPAKALALGYRFRFPDLRLALRDLLG